MACLEVPKVPVPQLPSPLKITLPSFDLPPTFDARLCCNVHIPIPNPLELPPFNSLPPIPPGPVINLGLINAVLGTLNKLNDWIDSLPKFTCPLE